MWPLGNVSTLGQCNAALSGGRGRRWEDSWRLPQQLLTRQMSGVAARMVQSPCMVSHAVAVVVLTSSKIVGAASTDLMHCCAAATPRPACYRS